MLAVVLLGFSTVLYLLADRYLHQQSQERLDAVLGTLSAAVDLGPEGAEWEPDARHLNLETPAYADPVVWIIGDHRGQLLDRSKTAGTEQFVESRCGVSTGELEHWTAMDQSGWGKNCCR